MNVATVVGRLTRDVESRTTQNGNQIADFGVAINEGKNSTLFLEVKTFGKTAELVSQYYAKGDVIGISGKIATDTWEDKNNPGQKRSKTYVIANSFFFIPGTTSKKKVGEPTTDNSDAPIEDENNNIPF